MAHPDKTVECVSGDASILMNVQELATARQHRAPVKVVACNISWMGMVRQWQDFIHGGRYSESDDESMLDFVTVARGFGWQAARVDQRDELDAAVQICPQSEGPYFFDVRVSAHQNCFSMIPAGCGQLSCFSARTGRVPPRPWSILDRAPTSDMCKTPTPRTMSLPLTTGLVALPHEPPLEQVTLSTDTLSDLRIIVAIHSTARGLAFGARRLWAYAKDSAALADDLCLSLGMSLKNALADLPFGGVKAVITRPAQSFDRGRLIEAFGRVVERQGGSYVPLEGAGNTTDDMRHLQSKTRYVSGTGAAARPAANRHRIWCAPGKANSNPLCKAQDWPQCRPTASRSTLIWVPGPPLCPAPPVPGLQLRQPRWRASW